MYKTTDGESHTHTCNDVCQVENEVKFFTAKALREVNSTIFDAQSSRLANVLGKRDYALEQGCDLDKAVVVQRQAPMVQTVLKAQRRSAVAVRRRNHRHPCIGAEAEP